MTVEESLDWLPTGWVMEVRMRRSGRKYKCYTAPLTGRKFYSKTQVSHYLKTGMTRKRSKRKRRGADTPSATNVVVETNKLEEGLPPGWIKEIKVKEAGRRIIRKDAYYIDPATGHVFRSKKEVFNYLETGEVHKRVRKPKKKLIKDAEFMCQEIPLPVAAKRQQLAGLKTTRCLFTGDSSNGSKTVKHKADKQKLESSTRNEQKADPINAFNLFGNGGKAADFSAVTPLEDPALGKIKSNRILTEGRMISASCIGQIPTERQPLMNGMEKHWNEKPQSDSRRNKDKKGLHLPRRTSKRLADLKAKPAILLSQCRLAVISSMTATHENWVDLVSKQLDQFETKPLVDAAPSARNPLNEGENPRDSEKQLTNYGQLFRNQEAAEACAKNHETDKEDKEGSNVKQESPVTLTEEHIGNLETGKGDAKLESPTTLKTKDKGVVKSASEITLPEECFGNPDTGKEVDVKQELRISFPFGDSWPDPCLEFAFKTLTGEISVDNDYVIQGYFQRQFNPVPAQNISGFKSADFCVDNFLQTDEALLKFDLLEQPAPSSQSQDKSSERANIPGECSTSTTLVTCN